MDIATIASLHVIGTIGEGTSTEKLVEIISTNFFANSISGLSIAPLDHISSEEGLSSIS